MSSWYDKIGTSHENSSNREAPNKHIKGSKKYKEMIARDTKRIDDHGNMPFKFIKPPRRSQPRREIFFVCKHCSKVGIVNKYTVGAECSGCQKYTSIGDENKYSSEEALLEALGQPTENQPEAHE